MLCELEEDCESCSTSKRMSLCTSEHHAFFLAVHASYAADLCSCRARFTQHDLLHMVTSVADGAKSGDKLHWCFGPNAILTSSSATVGEIQQ